MQAQIAGLEIQCDKLADTESHLSEALEACQNWEQQVERLRFDIDQMKKASLKASRTHVSQNTLADVSGHKSRKSAQVASKTTGTQVGPATRNLAIQTDAIERQSHPAEADQSLSRTEATQSPKQNSPQDEIMKQHYATLSNELGLQRNLIDKMIKLKAATKKPRSRAHSSGISTGTAGHVTETPNVAVMQKTNHMSDQFLTWPILFLYSVIFVLLGYLIASRMSVTSTSGVSYAEMKAWERANSITYLLDHHGVLSSSGPYRWWEGRWMWLEMAGYWLEEKLQDRPWPS